MLIEDQTFERHFEWPIGINLLTVLDSEETVSKKRTKMKRNTEMEELTHLMARMAQMMEQNQIQRSTNVPKFRTMG